MIKKALNVGQRLGRYFISKTLFFLFRNLTCLLLFFNFCPIPLPAPTRLQYQDEKTNWFSLGTVPLFYKGERAQNRVTIVFVVGFW